MAYAPSVARAVRLSGNAQGESVVPVILDHGDHARVATLAVGCSPQVGDRFDLEGLVWEITRVKDLQRGYVARPVKPGTCVH